MLGNRLWWSVKRSQYLSLYAEPRDQTWKMSTGNREAFSHVGNQTTSARVTAEPGGDKASMKGHPSALGREGRAGWWRASRGR